jgi:SAM-dependent methyltransferase
MEKGGFEYIGNELGLFKGARNWKSYFSSKIGKYIAGDVLEVGAGIGINTEFLVRSSSAIKSVTLLEPDQEQAEQIPKNLAAWGGNARVVVGTTADLKGEFDSILYIDVIEHIEDASMELKRAKELLKPGGFLIVLVPAYAFLFSPFDAQIGHFRRYNRKVLGRELPQGLIRKEEFYLDSMGFFASLANRFLLKQSAPTKANIQFWDKGLIPLSKLTDVLTFNQFGKSLVGVFQKPA